MPRHLLSEILPQSFDDESYFAPVLQEMGGVSADIMEQGDSQHALMEKEQEIEDRINRIESLLNVRT
jgi:hypothetical protein